MALPLEGEFRNPSGCAVSAMISRSGKRFSGDDIIKSISIMHERSNGLGGGFAAYGIYPEYAEHYAFHLFFNHEKAKHETEEFLKEHFGVVAMHEIPTRKTSGVGEAPMIWRYFATPIPTKLEEAGIDEGSYVSACVFSINKKIEGAYVFSSGKNMGSFKGVGYPEDIGRFYRLDEYSGYCFTAHGRYPTNTPGWWGGAHPFSILDTTVVHNGEISSYDANRRTIEQYGYSCDLQTDTEAIAYMVDYLHRRLGLTLLEAAHIMAAPFWETIERMPEEQKSQFLYLRQAFAPFLINGPFSILVGFTGGLMALNDRLKLRSMVMGESSDGDMVYFSSEESAIRVIAPDAKNIYAPKGGEPIIVTVQN